MRAELSFTRQSISGMLGDFECKLVELEDA